MGVLEGRVAIVTGAGRGVGAGIAAALAREGARIAVVDIDAETGTATAKQITALGGQAAFFTCDIRETAQIDACVAAVADRWETVDILVNNAIAVNAGIAAEDITDADFNLVWETGPRATLAFMRACYPHLRDGGRIINVRSGSEFQTLPGYAHYIAAKSAIGGLTRAAAREWGRDGITVNAVCPFVLSPAVVAYFDDRPDELKAIVKGFSIPRVGDAEADIGRTVVYLAGPDAGYVTGQTINVDGGAVFTA